MPCLLPEGSASLLRGCGVGSYLSLVQVSRSVCQVELSLSLAVCQTALSSQHPSALDPMSWLPSFGRAMFFLRAHGAPLLGSQEKVGEVDSEFSGSAAPSLLLAAHTAWIPLLCLSGQNSGFHKVHWSHSKGSLEGQGSQGGVHGLRSCSLRLILPSFSPSSAHPSFPAMRTLEGACSIAKSQWCTGRVQGLPTGPMNQPQLGAG
jgi:hypothetical protein